jgi:hypothetical protein
MCCPSVDRNKVFSKVLFKIYLFINRLNKEKLVAHKKD